MSYQSFTSNWVGQGKHVDPDNQNDFQCVKYIKQYLIEEFGVPNGAYGNAIDYWNKTAGVILQHFDKIPTRNPQQGDIVVLAGLPGNNNGHIMIATGAINSGAFGGSEQNGQDGSGNGLGGNAIRYRYVTQNRIVGVLRPKQSVVTASAIVSSNASSGHQIVRITGDYRTFYASPGGQALTKLEPNRLGGGHLDYAVLDHQGDYVKIERQDGSGQGWIYIGSQGGASGLTQFLNA